MSNTNKNDYQDIGYYSALNSMPEYERSIILNNGLENAPSPEKESKTQQGQCLSLPFDAGKDYARKVLRQELHILYPNTKWQTLGKKTKGYWPFRAKFRQAIKKEANIMDSNFNPFREHNFLRCGARNSGGHIYTYEDGQKRLAVMKCSETTACPECADSKASEVANRTFELLRAIAEANEIKRMWFFVFTLPAKHEAKPLKGTKERKALLQNIKTMIRKTFGLKTRDLLASYCSVHSTGGSNLMRTRVHFHVGVLPAAVARKKGAEYAYKNVDPKGLIDLDKLKKEWQQAIQNAGLTCKNDEINLKAEYVELPDAWGKMRHRINYDLRGFGSDFVKSAIFHGDNLVCISANTSVDYQAVTIEQLAKRWRFIRKQRDYRPWGIIAKQEAYADLLHIEKITETPPAQTSIQDVVVENDIGRAFDVKTKKVKWEETTIVKDSVGNIILEWKLGRLGKRELWWPKNKPRPKPKTTVPEIEPDETQPIFLLTHREQCTLF